MCSAASEAFGATRTLSAPAEHAESEEEGRRTSEPLGSLIGDVLANVGGLRAHASIEMLVRTATAVKFLLCEIVILQASNDNVCPLSMIDMHALIGQPCEVVREGRVSTFLTHFFHY